MGSALVGFGAGASSVALGEVEELGLGWLAVLPPIQTKPAEAISSPAGRERQVLVPLVVMGGEKDGLPQEGVSEICSTACPDWQLGNETALTPRLLASPSMQLAMASGPTGLPRGCEQLASVKNWTRGPSWVRVAGGINVNIMNETPGMKVFMSLTFPSCLGWLGCLGVRNQVEWEECRSFYVSHVGRALTSRPLSQHRRVRRSGRLHSCPPGLSICRRGWARICLHARTVWTTKS